MPLLQIFATRYDSLWCKVHAEAVIFLIEERSFLMNAIFHWGLDQRFHMEVIDIDQVEGLPAIAYYEREINLIESW